MSEQWQIKLDAVLVPCLLPLTGLAGIRCAVIDVLRASTTIIAALANGAREIRPCVSAAEATESAATLKEGEYLLGGEEGGRMVPGFHLGNSPLEYTAKTVTGKTVFLATTNGTPTLRKVQAQSGLPVYIAALTNLSAVCAQMANDARKDAERGLAFVCAGQNGRPTAEDIFCAGLAIQKVSQTLTREGFMCHLTDGASIAAGYALCQHTGALPILAASEHGRYLQNIGFSADLEFAAQVDACSILPVFQEGGITLFR